MSRRLLLLGGTAAARDLAARLTKAGLPVTASLAGATRRPAAYPCPVRVGGFGGVEGLTAALRTGEWAALLDATHPFAARITAQAVAAARAAGVPYARLSTPPWSPPDGARWRAVADLAAAVAAPPAGARVLLAIGQAGRAFAPRSDLTLWLRAVEPPPEEVASAFARILLARPPFEETAETELMREGRLTHLVVKNSGAPSGAPKLAAAAALGLEIIAIDPPALAEAFLLETPEAAVCWARARLAGAPAPSCGAGSQGV